MSTAQPDLETLVKWFEGTIKVFEDEFYREAAIRNLDVNVKQFWTMGYIVMDAIDEKIKTAYPVAL